MSEHGFLIPVAKRLGKEWSITLNGEWTKMHPLISFILQHFLVAIDLFMLQGGHPTRGLIPLKSTTRNRLGYVLIAT